MVERRFYIGPGGGGDDDGCELVTVAVGVVGSKLQSGSCE